MPVPAIERLRISGYRSLREVELRLGSPDGVTLLIGANGSGKSNLVGAIELLSHIIEGQMQTAVGRLGGVHRLLHVNQADEQSSSFALEVWFEPDDEGLRNGYRAEVTAAADDEYLLGETLYLHATQRYSKPYDEWLGSGRESKLNRLDGSTRMGRFAQYIRPSLEGLRVFHFDDASMNAPARLTAEVGDDLSLNSDASNLAAYLMRLRDEDAEAYARIRTVVRNVAPFFDDFVLRPHGAQQEFVLLRWRQRGSTRTFSGSQLSDGTLRFICLATALLSPHRPRYVVLDEPELGLHPFAIHQLAALIKQAAGIDNRCIVATQSPLLIDEFCLESIAVLDRSNGATVITRPDARELEVFLDDYSLGELWRSNLIGGRPQHRERGLT